METDNREGNFVCCTLAFAKFFHLIALYEKEEIKGLDFELVSGNDDVEGEICYTKDDESLVAQ